MCRGSPAREPCKMRSRRRFHRTKNRYGRVTQCSTGPGVKLVAARVALQSAPMCVSQPGIRPPWRCSGALAGQGGQGKVGRRQTATSTVSTCRDTDRCAEISTLQQQLQQAAGFCCQPGDQTPSHNTTSRSCSNKLRSVFYLQGSAATWAGLLREGRRGAPPKYGTQYK